MTKFEQNGVNIQFSAETKRWAIQKFAGSCHICCMHGLRIDCDRCAIAVANSTVVSAIDTITDIKKVI